MSTTELSMPPSPPVSEDGPPSSSTTQASSASSGMSVSSQSSVADLPASAYDGSHLHWKAFRQHVLAPHNIRVLETPPKGTLPESFLACVDTQSQNIERFDAQKCCFREQVNEGRGFGPSPLFPPNLLPSVEHQPRLARCMVPAFNREALPTRSLNQAGPLYELSVPRPGLGCGFSSLAFSNEEINILPSSLVGTGTSVDFSTGYISPSHAVYCPFLVFERAFGKKEHRLEAANNQCAIGGAYCCRTLSLLYTSAYPKDRRPSPSSFSCTVDNDFAIINYHWIDEEQTYHMAPLCKFDLRRDDHFSHFAAWIDAIGEWALAHVLPQVKSAIASLQSAENSSPGFIQMKAAKKLVLSTESNKNDTLIKSLKTTFDNIPWRFEDDEFTPVSSSCASWGSPMVDDMLFSTVTYPPVPRVKSLKIGSEEVIPASIGSSDVAGGRISTSPFSDSNSPQGGGAYNSNLVSLKRLDHAMNEIRDLHAQLETMKGSSTDFRAELAGLRDTLSSVLRKESAMVRQRSLLARRISSPDLVPSSPTDGPVLGLPSRAQSYSHSGQSFRNRSPGSLHIRTDLAHSTSSLKQFTLPPPTPPSTSHSAASSTSTTSKYSTTTHPGTKGSLGPTLTLSCNGVDMVLSPTQIRRQQQFQSFDSHKSPLSARAPPWSPAPRTPMTGRPPAWDLPHDLREKTPITTMQIEKPSLPSPNKNGEQSQSNATTPTQTRKDQPELPGWQSYYYSIPLQTRNLLRWTATLGAGYLLVSYMPSEMIKWFVVGCAADYCLRNIQGGDGKEGLLSLLQGHQGKAQTK